MVNKATLYTMCNDDRLISLCTLLESNNLNDKWKVKVIPFDDNIKYLTQLSKIYSFDIVEIDQKWDDLGKSIYNDEEYRKGLPSWRYFRKFNVFNSDNEDFVFLDSNVVICSSLNPVISILDNNSFVFAARSGRDRNFKPWFEFLLNRLDSDIKDGFNAGFWAGNSNNFRDVNFKRLSNFSDLRSGLSVSPEQSFLNILLVFYKCKYVHIKNKIDCHAMISGDRLLSSSLLKKEEGYYLDNKEVLTIKWNGSYYTSKQKLPNAVLLRDTIQSALYKIGDNIELKEFLNNQIDFIGA